MLLYLCVKGSVPNQTQQYFGTDSSAVCLVDATQIMQMTGQNGLSDLNQIWQIMKIVKIHPDYVNPSLLVLHHG